MNEMMYGNYIHIDIIVHDVLVIYMSRVSMWHSLCM